MYLAGPDPNGSPVLKNILEWDVEELEAVF